MSDPQTKRMWSGGAYQDREGITVIADSDGVAVESWYDGGITILQESGGSVRLTWDELDAMRKATR